METSKQSDRDFATDGSRPPLRNQRFVFLGAGTPWVYALAESLALAGNRVSAIAPFDTRTYKRNKPQWPAREAPAGLAREHWVYPPGYAGTFAGLFAPVLYSRLKKSFPTNVSNDGDDYPWIIGPYPWFNKALRRVPSDRLIYYNFDDYVLYQPSRATSTLNDETELIERAALTVCSAETQVESLRTRCPRRAESIRHFPLGAVETLLNPSPEQVPEDRSVVGFVGNLVDRVDWPFIRKIAPQMPDVEFRFVGGMDGQCGGGTNPNWEQDRAAALALPNVRRVGPVKQDDVGQHYWNFAVTWIPYDTTHAFNRAASPTKIMDGLASGRPVLSSDIPECRLYPEYISIFHSVDEAVSQIREKLASAASAASIATAERQVQFVRQNHLWDCRAQWLLERLAELRR